MKEKADEPHLADLATRYLDQNLAADEAAELDRLLVENPRACEQFEAFLGQAFAIAESGHTPSKEEECELKAVSFSIESPPERRAWIPLLAAAGLTILAIASFLLLDGRAAPVVATLSFEGGEGRLGGADVSGLIQVVPPDKKQELVSGQWFQLDDEDGSAELAFADGTRVVFFPPVEARLEVKDSQKTLKLKEGRLSADVTPQPSGRPFQILTRSGKLEVLGTELEVATTDGSTDLVVTHGLVAMVRDTDGASLEVGAGQRASIVPDSSVPLEAISIPQLPDRWEHDFNSPPEANWDGGKWQPEGSMLAHPRFDLGYSHFAIVSSNAWQDGIHSHFQVYPDSYLEVRFKMEKPQWFVIRIGLRATLESTRKFGGNAFYQNNQWHRDLEPGEWRTVRFSLSEIHHFSRTKSRDINLNGLGAYLISVSTQENDAGLVIDEIKVGRNSAN